MKLRTQTLGLPRTVARCWPSSALPESWRPSVDYVSAAQLGLVGRAAFALAADVPETARRSRVAEAIDAVAVRHSASLAAMAVAEARP